MGLDALNAIAARSEPERDRWGRYVIPHPRTGKKQSWTRATTWAKTLDDTFALTKWELRMAGLGLVARADLLASVASIADPESSDGKKALNRTLEDAKEAGGATVRRNLGTALHAFAEQLDLGQAPTIPEPHREDMAAYIAALKTHGIEVDPQWIERVVTVPEFMVAGTFDRLVHHRGELVVADLKTGSTVSYAMGAIAIQLALYANAETIWDAQRGEHIPMPDLSKTRGLVLHLAAGSGECVVHEVDLEAGWEAARTCGLVRDWRGRKDLSSVVSSDSYRAQVEAEVATLPDIPIPKTRSEWIEGRITILLTSAAAKRLLGERWPQGVPKRGPWDDATVDALHDVITGIETLVEAPFPMNDPASQPPSLPDWITATAEPRWIVGRTPIPDGPAVGSDEEEALKATAKTFTPAQVNACKRWRHEGKTFGAPWGGAVADGRWSRRCFDNNRVAVAAVSYLWDDEDPDALITAAIWSVLDECPDEPVGVLIGALDESQSEAVFWLAHNYSAGMSDAISAISALIHKTINR